MSEELRFHLYLCCSASASASACTSTSFCQHRYILLSQYLSVPIQFICSLAQEQCLTLPYFCRSFEFSSQRKRHCLATLKNLTEVKEMLVLQVGICDCSHMRQENIHCQDQDIIWLLQIWNDFPQKAMLSSSSWKL